jgi:NAD dependent epimerase/dehydratase family
LEGKKMDLPAGILTLQRTDRWVGAPLCAIPVCEPITIFGDGRQTRDFIYVKDVVAADAFFALKSQVTGVFNIACGRQITITDLALTIRNLAKSSSTIRYGAERLGDVQYSVAGADKTRQLALSPFLLWLEYCAQQSNFSGKAYRASSRALTYDAMPIPLGQLGHHRFGRHPTCAHALAIDVCDR